MNPKKCNKNSKFFKEERNFFVCSFGGCGSWMLVDYLSNFGNAFHIHSRNPPKRLTYVEEHKEAFSNRRIPDEQVKNYKVIYLYKNPIEAIYSRFVSPQHLKNIECKFPEISLIDVVGQKLDLYGINQFFNNYMTSKANYDIICVKYEDFFHDIEKLNQTLEIENVPEYYPQKKESNREAILQEIYGPLIEKMNSMDFITVVSATNEPATDADYVMPSRQQLPPPRKIGRIGNMFFT